MEFLIPARIIGAPFIAVIVLSAITAKGGRDHRETLSPAR
jgi:hypothetical protein